MFSSITQADKETDQLAACFGDLMESIVEREGQVFICFMINGSMSL